MLKENLIIQKIKGYTLWFLTHSPGPMMIGRSYDFYNNIYIIFYRKLRKRHAG